MKAKKNKKGKKVAESPTLEEQIVILQEELDREQKLKSDFQLEQNKIQAFWETSKRSHQETKVKLRKTKEKNEVEESCQAKDILYKKKLRHVLFEYHKTTSGMKMDHMVMTSLVLKKHIEAEIVLHRHRHNRKVDFMEKMLNNENNIKELKSKHQLELLELKSDQRRIREMEGKHHKNVQMETEAKKEKQAAEVNKLDHRIKSSVETVVEDLDRALRSVHESYSASYNNVQEDQKLLRKEAEAAEQEARAKRSLPTVQQESKHLSESLHKGQDKLPKVEKQLEEYNQAEAERVMTKARVKTIDNEWRELTVVYELLLQAFEKVQQERDELLKKHKEVTAVIQQKIRRKDLLLERNRAAQTEMVVK